MEPRLGEIEVNARPVDRTLAVTAGRHSRLWAALQALRAVDALPSSAQPIAAASAAALGRLDLVSRLQASDHNGVY